jgi:hypothetical protein
MADSKISALPASTTPLAGTEVLPIVQSSTTKQVSVANLTAGRDIAATSLTTTAVQATNSGGLTLKNSGGTTQISLGAGGGDNITLSVATNITPANAAVAISPTGTGTVAISPTGALTINPTAASTINNTSIGATTASTGRFTGVTLPSGNIEVSAGYLSLSDANSLSKITSPAITLTGAGGTGTGGQTVNIATSGTFLGFLAITSSQGESAIFFVGGSVGSLLISQTTGIRFSALSGGANTANVYVSGSNLVLENNIQATRNFNVCLIGKI